MGFIKNLFNPEKKPATPPVEEKFDDSKKPAMPGGEVPKQNVEEGDKAE